jgi:hypothetical protein
MSFRVRISGKHHVAEQEAQTGKDWNSMLLVDNFFWRLGFLGILTREQLMMSRGGIIDKVAMNGVQHFQPCGKAWLMKGVSVAP